MKSIEKILVAVDFSQYSAEILKYAFNLAGPLGASLVVVNVLNQRDITAIRRVVQRDVEIKVDEYIATEKKRRSKKIEKLIAESGARGLPQGCGLRCALAPSCAPTAVSEVTSVRRGLADAVVRKGLP